MEYKSVKLLRNIAMLGLVLSYLAINFIENVEVLQIEIKIEMPTIVYPPIETAKL